MKRIIPLVIFFVAYFGSVFFILMLLRSTYYDGLNKHIETALSSTAGDEELNPQLMSHRLILSDERDGLITHQNAKKSFSHTAGYFSDVRKNCIKEYDQQTETFLSCANQLLGEHFYYYPTRETGIAWAEHYSDCDSNVYLLLDALSLVNKTASIVYAPGHAFISWKDEQTGESEWWETTSNHNHGHLADLNQNDLYQKTLAPFYYHPQSSAFAESFYTSVVTLNSLQPELKEKRMKKIVAQYPDNPFVDDLKYEQIKSLTPADITRLQALLQTDISSTTKKYLLANYYLNNHNQPLARKYIDKIDIGSCGPECRQLKKRLSPVDNIWLTLSDLLSKKTVSNNYGSFSVEKLKFPVSHVKQAFYATILIFIAILAVSGAHALCRGSEPTRTSRQSAKKSLYCRCKDTQPQRDS